MYLGEIAALWLSSWPQQPPGPHRLDHNSPGSICWGHCPHHKQAFISHSSAQIPVVVFSCCSNRWPPAAGCTTKKHLNGADLKPVTGRWLTEAVNTLTHIHGIEKQHISSFKSFLFFFVKQNGAAACWEPPAGFKLERQTCRLLCCFVVVMMKQ